MPFNSVIGLEIHVELNTKSKMFCSDPNDRSEKRPNVNVCPICLGHPGTLPVINKEAVKKVIITGLALRCEIPENSRFDRKNYFYPDLPKGYQISQYDMPLCKNGFLDIGDKKIRIRRIHLEEDTGSLIHPAGADYSLADFNRAGAPLMELVTEPDIGSAEEAKKFCQELQLILKYLGVSDADMEKGQMRCEVNISLNENKARKLGVKVEIKNLNSFRAVEKAIVFEIKRQADILEKKGKVIQETRGWDAAKEKTFSQRTKEEAHDYRYFPEPDLPLLYVGDKKNESQKSGWEINLSVLKAHVLELPRERRKRFKKEYNLSEKEIEVFVQNKSLGNYFEKAMSELRNWVREADIKEKTGKPEFFRLAKLCSNYISTDLMGLLNGSFPECGAFPITPENFAEFITMIYKGTISSKIAKVLLKEMLETKADPSQIIEKKGLIQLSDESQIEKILKEVILKNQKAVEDYKKGKESAFQFLIGQIMAATKGKADPQIARDILKKELKK